MLALVALFFGFFWGVATGYFGCVLDHRRRARMSVTERADILSVRIESGRADVVNWRVVDRTTGTDLTHSLARVDIALVPGEEILARLQFKSSEQGTPGSRDARNPDIALTAIADVEEPLLRWEGDVPKGTTFKREDA